jgi:hypothetical protein
MKMNRLFLLNILVVIAFAANAQSPNILADKIQWNATGFKDLNSNTVVATPCQFISTASQINWVQGNGTYTETFTISGANGPWPDLNQPGSIIFSVSQASLNGTITFSKSSSGITIKLVLTGGTSPINILYTISTFEKL